MRAPRSLKDVPDRTWRDALASTLSDQCPAHHPPGAVAGIRVGEQEQVTSTGVGDLRTGETATAEHVMDIASVSKVLTTLAALRLIEQGRLHLKQTLGELLRDRAHEHSDVTVEDLLRHRAGMQAWAPLYLLEGPDPVDRALRLPPRSAPGTEHVYSDLGLIVLGRVLETIDDAPLPAVIRAEVVDRLALTGASLTPGAPVEDRPVLTGGHGDDIEREMVRQGHPDLAAGAGSRFPWRTENVRREIGDGNAHHAFGGAAGHAGWFSGAEALLSLGAALADPQRLDLSSQAAGLLSRQVDPGQGLGLRVYQVPWNGGMRRMLGHPGFTGAFLLAAPATDIDQPLQLALLANRLHGDPAPDRGHLHHVEQMGLALLARVDAVLHPIGDK